MFSSSFFQQPKKMQFKKIVSIVSIVFKPPQGSLAAKGLAREPCRLAQRLAAHGRVARLGLFAASAVGSVALQLVHTLDGGIELKA